MARKLKKLRKKSGAKRIFAAGTVLDDDLKIVDHLGGSRKVDIYLCRSKRLKRHVACKILREKYTSDRSVVRAVLREGEILLRMRHPNVIEGYAVEMEPQPRIVMQQLRGQTLDTAFMRGNHEAFELQDFIDVALQMADALTYVHAAGLLHLDLKPSNVMYLDGHITLFDFSVAHTFTPGEELKTNAGTRGYKSPEQESKGDAGYYSDVFSLGIVFYRLLTGGEKAFPSIKRAVGEEGKTIRVLDYTADVRPPSELNPAVTEGVSDVVMRALRVDPAERIANPGEFKNMLEDAARGVAVL